jgi:hypothetical protein
MTRRDAEIYLRQHGTSFVPRCCADGSRNTWDAWIKIGEEPQPWYCGAHRVYIVLTFRRTDGQSPVETEAHDTDALTDITIFHAMETRL